MDHPTAEQALQILRELPGDQAFYFYSGIGVPLGASANSLGRFVEEVKSIEPGSIEFHVHGGDFAKWVEMLGDQILSQRLIKLEKVSLSGEPLRRRLLHVLGSRYGLLMKLSSNPPSGR